MVRNCLLAIFNEYESDLNSLEFAGTGFFINNGIFLTAAHVLNNCKKSYAVLENAPGKLYEINLLHKEYLSISDLQCLEDFDDYLDLAICKIDIPENNYFQLNTEEIEKNQELIFVGYAPTGLYSKCQNEEERILAFEYKEFGGNLVFEFAKFSRCNTRFSNCFTFKTNYSAKRKSPVKGMSGGPIFIFKNGQFFIVGLFLLSEINMPNPLSYAISSNYILSKIID